MRALTDTPADVAASVALILGDVRERGDTAVHELTLRFDSDAAPEDFRVPASELATALAGLDPDVRAGLEVARDNIERLARAEPTDDVSVEMPQGQQVAIRDLAVRRAGVYVPGGRAAYPSSVLMCCVPARVAAVDEIAIATPPDDSGRANPVILAACALCGVEEVHLMGGAQAIAALAHGTDTVAPVDVIVGPGNAYVQEAKRQVAGTVGLDGIAGPSELVVVADEGADPDTIALDLAAQAEHGPDTLVAAVSPHRDLLTQVEHAAAALAAERESVQDAALALVHVPDLEAAIVLADAIAPEHLELACADAATLAARIRASGCVFIGHNGGAAFGDYAAGSNHVLPTGGAARFAGPLGTTVFRRRQALVSLPAHAARALAPHVASVARAEGFPVHAESAEARAQP
jgi:histidinol dehydrogenase